MNKTGFTIGQCVRFQSHDCGETIGIVIGQSFAAAFDATLSPRDYCIVYCGKNGTPTHDSMVSECWIKPYTGHVPQDVFHLFDLFRRSVEEETTDVYAIDEDSIDED